MITNFSFFENIYQQSTKVLNLEDLLNLIESDTSDHYPAIKQLRAEQDAVKAAKIKSSLPAVSLSVVYNGRRKKENIVGYSGLLGIDIDNLSDPNSAKEKLKGDPYLLACFISPSGRGLKLVYRSNPEQHLTAFKHLSQYLHGKFGLTVDQQCKDIGRMMFLSYDSEVYYKPDANPLDELIREPKVTSNEKNISDFIKVVDEIERSGIDITSSYDNWIRVGFICNELMGSAGREYFHRLSQFYPKYSRAETDRQFDYCKNSHGAGISPGTFFHLAKQHGINLSRKNGKPGLTNNSGSKSYVIDERFIFWEVNEKDGKLVITILYTKLNDLLMHLGFRRFDIDLTNIFIKITDNIVEEVPITWIQDALITWIDNLPDELPGGISREELREKIFKGINNYISEKRFTLLNKGEVFNFKKDLRNVSFVYYKNGFARISAEKVEFIDYSELDGLIWKKQVIQREFPNLANASDLAGKAMFAKFLVNICGANKERYKALLTIIGYLLHQYFDGKRKCLILTDSKISDLPEGRTGKTILALALSYIRRYCEIDGKSFDPENRFKWQEVDRDTEIIHLNDVKANFTIDALFTAITESVKVEKKNKPPFYITSKLVVSSNRTVITEGASRKDRVIEFEVSDYYHKDFSPEDDFGCWLFKDWDNDEWKRFDALMVEAIKAYFQNGLLQPPTINLERRKLLDQVNPDFVDFMDKCISDGSIAVNTEIKKNDIHRRFLSEYPDYAGDRLLSQQREFTKLLISYSKYSPLIEEINAERDERKSGPNYFVTLRQNNNRVG